MDPTLLLRDEAAENAYRRASGITLEHEGQLSHCPVHAIPISQLTGSITHLLVTTKAQDTAAALETVSPFLSAHASIVLLQNGLRQLEATRLWPGKRVYCLSTSHGAWLASRFHVVHAGIGNAWLGQADGGHDCETLLAGLPADTMQIRCDRNIAARLWRKFAVNCAANALTVMYACPNGELLTIPAARQQLRALCAEIEQILRAIPDAPVFDVFTEVEQVLLTTASNYSSTLQDVRKGRATELPELNGYLCELADKHDVSCRLNRALYDAVMSLDARRPPPG